MKMSLEIKNGKLTVYRDCPTCAKFLETSTLHTNIRQKEDRFGNWYHTSKWGRSLHKYVVKKNERETL